MTSKETSVLLSGPSSGAVARASSVLQRNVKMYGPMNALNIEDGSSCWYSDGEENSSQSFTISFGRLVKPTELRIQFQAGFSAETCIVQARTETDTWETVEEVEPSDSHEIQNFPLETNTKSVNSIKIVFNDFTDFYGRVTVYRLGVYGKEVS